MVRVTLLDSSQQQEVDTLPTAIEEATLEQQDQRRSSRRNSSRGSSPLLGPRSSNRAFCSSFRRGCSVAAADDEVQKCRRAVLIRYGASASNKSLSVDVSSHLDAFSSTPGGAACTVSHNESLLLRRRRSSSSSSTASGCNSSGDSSSNSRCSSRTQRSHQRHLRPRKRSAGISGSMVVPIDRAVHQVSLLKRLFSSKLQQQRTREDACSNPSVLLCCSDWCPTTQSHVSHPLVKELQQQNRHHDLHLGQSAAAATPKRCGIGGLGKSFAAAVATNVKVAQYAAHDEETVAADEDGSKRGAAAPDAGTSAAEHVTNWQQSAAVAASVPLVDAAASRREGAAAGDGVVEGVRAATDTSTPAAAAAARHVIAETEQAAGDAARPAGVEFVSRGEKEAAEEIPAATSGRREDDLKHDEESSLNSEDSSESRPAFFSREKSRSIYFPSRLKKEWETAFVSFRRRRQGSSNSSNNSNVQTEEAAAT